jgi:hypothetical protein
MLNVLSGNPTPAGTTGVVYMKNMSYTYVWFYLPPAPVKLP